MPLPAELQENSSCPPRRPSSACPLRPYPARAAKTSRPSRALLLSAHASPPTKARSAKMPSATQKAVPGAVIRSLHPPQETRSRAHPAHRHRASCESNQSCAAEKFRCSSLRLSEKSSSIFPALLQLHLKSQRQYGRERHHTNAIRAGKHHRRLGQNELREYLPACTARRTCPAIQIRNCYRLNLNLRPELRYRSHERRPLGTNREPVTDILDVGPRDCRTVRQQQCCTNLESGVGRIRSRGRLTRLLQQFLKSRRHRPSATRQFVIRRIHEL